ncbi:MAG: N-acetylmuramoyl-L-alanine amidase [Deltaproteobacteria bacterium]|nr:N-acetylmuramoyl-L-alanine amidase [Deltaproteobacteria bacterium]
MRKFLVLVGISVLLCVLTFTSFLDSINQVLAAHKNRNIRSQKYAIVREIRYWSGATHTRIVIDLDKEVAYKDQLLKKDIALDKPPRLFIDLTRAKLSPELREPISIEAGLLKQVRAGQYTPDTVRVVLDLESVADYRIFPLKDPFRVVIDVLGTSQVPKKKEETAKVSPLPAQPQPFKLVLDPGHGGEDPGAIGPTGLKEKDVVLRISTMVREKIKKEMGWDVVMTREDDRFIRLEDRTAIASTEEGRLFISIHANACKDRGIRGIESYVIGTTTNRDALRLAAKENNISPRQVSDLQVILTDLKLNDPTKVIPSRQLAECVQMSLVSSLHKRYGQAKDLGVKPAPFIVLVGAEMPSTMIEVSFISNPTEERMLRDQHYLDALADAIVEGLKRYAQDAKMVKVQPSQSVSTALSSN